MERTRSFPCLPLLTAMLCLCTVTYLHMRTASRSRHGHASHRKDKAVASQISQTTHLSWIPRSIRRRSPRRRQSSCARVAAATQILGFASLDREGPLRSGGDEGLMVIGSRFVGYSVAALRFCCQSTARSRARWSKARLETACTKSTLGVHGLRLRGAALASLLRGEGFVRRLHLLPRASLMHHKL